jgi:hypothetical protein
MSLRTWYIATTIACGCAGDDPDPTGGMTDAGTSTSNGPGPALTSSDGPSTSTSTSSGESESESTAEPPSTSTSTSSASTSAESGDAGEESTGSAGSASTGAADCLPYPDCRATAVECCSCDAATESECVDGQDAIYMCYDGLFVEYFCIEVCQYMGCSGSDGCEVAAGSDACACTGC